MFRGILQFIPTVARFLKPVATKVAQTLLKSWSEAIKEGITVKDVIMYALKPTVGAVQNDTVDQVASNFIQMRDNHDAAPPTNPPIVVPEIIQTRSGQKQRHAPVYTKSTKRIKYLFNQRPNIYNF